jgi:nucleotide-binding universal stress UspA family protein
MITMKRILCPTDFSPLSRRALGQAVALARWYDAEITLLHVSPLSVTAAQVPYIPPPRLAPEARAHLIRELTAFADSARAESVPIRIAIAEGNAATEILEELRATDYDVVVMGTHGRRGLACWVVGSVTETVLRHSPCPVLTVGFGSVGPPTPRLGTILCPVDFSPSSEGTAHAAGVLASEREVRLVLMHAIDRASGPPSPVPPGFDRAAYRFEAERAMRRRLARLRPAGYADSVEEVAAWGPADREILRVAREWGVGLIVMGAHGGSLDSALFGSVAHKVVRRAPCPVLVLPARAHPLAEAEPEAVPVGEES